MHYFVKLRRYLTHSNTFRSSEISTLYAAGRNRLVLVVGWSTYSKDHLRLNYIVDFYVP